ncbi:MAG TPA: GTPase [Candidatus Paceibacterota bacterium]|nr:GTPase [Candidatus Paceibacterota bacterium]
MPINAHPDYLAAEKEYIRAQTLKEKIEKLRKMISLAPSHKGAENLRAQLKTRLKKFLEKHAKEKKSKSKVGKQGIKKEDMQAAIIGMTNTGKSSLLSILTHAKPKISESKFTTVYPIVGIMNYSGTNIQLIEIPAIESEYYNKGIVNTADTVLILITNLEQIKKIEQELDKTQGKRIIIFNASSNQDLRRIKATLSSKKYNFVVLDLNSVMSEEENEELSELKNKIFQSFEKIRVYTKEPGKKKTNKPIILEPDSTIKDVAEKILKGFSSKVKETKIWGPSSKFPGQKVGLQHKLKDLDAVEFKTR